MDYGNPAHLLDAAKYVQIAWDAVEPISIKHCFQKAKIMDFKEPVPRDDNSNDAFDLSKLIQPIESIQEEITANDLEAFIHIDDEESPDFIEAIMEGVGDVLQNVQLEANRSDAEEGDEPELIIEDKSVNQFVGFNNIYSSLLEIGDHLNSESVKSMMGDNKHEAVTNAFEFVSKTVRSMTNTEKRNNERKFRQATLHDVLNQ